MGEQYKLINVFHSPDQDSGVDASEYMMELQESFFNELYDYFGGDIINSDSHPLKSAFLIYVEMKEEEKERKMKEEEKEDED